VANSFTYLWGGILRHLFAFCFPGSAGNLKRLQVLIADEFSTIGPFLSTTGPANQADVGITLKVLQSEDILNQRIQHLIDGVRSSEAFYRNARFKHVFLDLQYFHLVTIRRDLRNSITSMRILADAIRSNHPDQKEIVTRSNRLLEIDQLFKVADRTSLRFVAQRIVSGHNPLTSTQSVKCLELYTMQSERIVLEWFLSNMPFGKEKDLLRVYEDHTNNTNDSIEFF
jgi:hypothetical protein